MLSTTGVVVSMESSQVTSQRISAVRLRDGFNPRVVQLFCHFLQTHLPTLETASKKLSEERRKHCELRVGCGLGSWILSLLGVSLN